MYNLLSVDQVAVFTPFFSNLFNALGVSFAFKKPFFFFTFDEIVYSC